MVWFGRLISILERRYNNGERRKAKGALVAVGCIVGVFLAVNVLLLACVLLPYKLGLPAYCGIGLYLLASTVMVFFCLAGKTLRQEVRMTFEAADRSLEEGLQAEEVCACNGATEAIYLVAQTFRRSKSAVLMPTFRNMPMLVVCTNMMFVRSIR